MSIACAVCAVCTNCAVCTHCAVCNVYNFCRAYLTVPRTGTKCPRRDFTSCLLEINNKVYPLYKLQFSLNAKENNYTQITSKLHLHNQHFHSGHTFPDNKTV